MAGKRQPWSRRANYRDRQITATSCSCGHSAAKGMNKQNTGIPCCLNLCLAAWTKSASGSSGHRPGGNRVGRLRRASVLTAALGRLFVSQWRIAYSNRTVIPLGVLLVHLRWEDLQEGSAPRRGDAVHILRSVFSWKCFSASMCCCFMATLQAPRCTRNVIQ